jgi:sulfur carrier protein
MILREFKELLKLITISVNGSERNLQQPMSVAQLIEQMDLTGKRIAVERNGEIVPRSQFGETQLEGGDKIEIVGAVGGG